MTKHTEIEPNNVTLLPGSGQGTLTTPAGGELPVRTFERGEEVILVAKKTPVVDGSGLKNSLERWVVRYLVERREISLAERKVLMVAAVDRFGMAEELVAHRADVTFGDLIFTLGVPVPLHSLKTLDWVARIVAPIATQLPFKMLYPTGEKQEKTVSKYERFFRMAEVVAGDFHFIRRHMPREMHGKGVITNTVTESDVQLLRERGVSFLVTTTPNLGGRSFGTNVIEAALVAISGRSPEQLTAADYLDLFQRLQFQPRIERYDAAKAVSSSLAGSASAVLQRS